MPELDSPWRLFLMKLDGFVMSIFSPVVGSLRCTRRLTCELRPRQVVDWAGLELIMSWSVEP
jgi:hypothetical protein